MARSEAEWLQRWTFTSVFCVATVTILSTLLCEGSWVRFATVAERPCKAEFSPLRFVQLSFFVVGVFKLGKL